MAILPPLFAHRLGRDPGPDSSRAALRTTLAGPVSGVETDVCLSADGRLVLLHDPWLQTGTTMRGWVQRTTWPELRRARLRDRHGFATDESPLLVEELLEELPGGLGLQLEVKAHADTELARATAAALCRVIARHADGDRAEVISFHAAACAEAARLGARSRLVVWADYAPAALVAWARDAGVTGVCVEHFLLAPDFVAELRAGGLSVTTGTINELELALRAARLGVDAITTDCPAALRARASELAPGAQRGGCSSACAAQHHDDARVAVDLDLVDDLHLIQPDRHSQAA